MTLKPSSLAGEVGNFVYILLLPLSEKENSFLTLPGSLPGKSRAVKTLQ